MHSPHCPMTRTFSKVVVLVVLHSGNVASRVWIKNETQVNIIVKFLICCFICALNFRKKKELDTEFSLFWQALGAKNRNPKRFCSIRVFFAFFSKKRRKFFFLAD